MQSKPLSLLELNNQIKEVIANYLEKTYWVTGEISEIKINTSGHCYLELIQKDEISDQIVARSRATIWATTFRMIKPYFETTTNHTLSNGLSILVKVSVQYHEAYGLSLNISDIEPSFTIGELALQKQKVIQKLDEEGVLGMNKELEIPILCQKIAVISSSTAAGYLDFSEQLQNNAFNYKFYIKLFPAIMQGEEAERSVIAALDRIYKYESLFDVVVIIRGGGSKADLSCFDTYWLAYHITQFPLPVFTGIGHEQDDSVADLVAHSRFKTPTAVAAYLLDSFAELDAEIYQIQEKIVLNSRDLIRSANEYLSTNVTNISRKIKELVMGKNALLQNFNYSFVSYVKQMIHQKAMQLNKKEINLSVVSKKLSDNKYQTLLNLSRLLKKHLDFTLLTRMNALDRMHDKVTYLNPEKVLQRGYSISIKDGKAIKDASLLEIEDKIETILFKGKIISVLKKKQL